MKIEFKLNGNDYFIAVESNTYIPTKVGVVTSEKSANVGKTKEEPLGYFTKLGNAALRCVREEISSSPDTISLKEYTARIEALNASIAEQFKGIES